MKAEPNHLSFDRVVFGLGPLVLGIPSWILVLGRSGDVPLEERKEKHKQSPKAQDLRPPCQMIDDSVPDLR